MDYVKQFLHFEGVIGQGTYGKVFVTRLHQDQQQQKSPPSPQQLSPITNIAHSQSPPIKLLTPDGSQQQATTSPIRLTPSSHNASLTAVLPPSPNSSNSGTIISNDSGINSSNSNSTETNKNNFKHRGARFALKYIHPVTKPVRLASELRYLRDLGGRENVVRLHSAHFHMGSLFIVMDMIIPDRFVEFVAELDHEEIRLYMKNLILALRHVHSFNVMHRDIKPANFLFNRKQRKFLLVDFGLAQPSRSKSTGTGLFPSNKTSPEATLQFCKTPLNRNASANTPNIRPLKKGSMTISNTFSMVTASPRTPIAVTHRHQFGSHMYSENHDGRTDQHPMIIPNSPFMKMQSPAKRLIFNQTGSPATPNISTKRLLNPNETNDSIERLKKLRVSNIDDTREPVKLTVGAYESPVTNNDISASRSTRNQINQDSHKFSTPKVPRPYAHPRCDCRGKPKTCPNCLSRPDVAAPRSGTPGYKAPEVLLRWPYQTTAFDIWSAGVIMICLLSGHSPIFRDTDDSTSLFEIMSLLGSQKMIAAAREICIKLIVEPHREPMDLKNLCRQIRSSNKDKVQIDIAEEAFDLLERMLDPNPSTRITAEDALKHPWFERSLST